MEMPPPIPRKRRRREPDFECPYCGRSDGPRIIKKVSAVGWVLFVVLLLFCCTAPLCWIGFFVTEEERVCSECGCSL